MFVLSVIAAICSTTASLPQLFGKNAHLSNWSMILRAVGAILWVIYGFLILEWALVAGSGIAGLIEIILFLRTNCCAHPPD